MAKGDKKQRREAKRKEKRAEGRRRESVSPIKRLAEASGEIECWKTEGFAESGQMELFVYKRAAGISGIAWFLVDRGVVGLKDAWARVGVERGEFDEMLAGCRADGVAVRRVEVEEVRRWVAGGMRWARENGMRLPGDWARPVGMIGGVGDWKGADVSGFVKEFVGTEEELRERLVGEAFEVYVERRDVAFEFDAGEADVREASREEMEALAQLVFKAGVVAEELAGRTAVWLSRRGEMPSPQLAEAWAAVVAASALAAAEMPEGSDEEIADSVRELLQDLADRVVDERIEEYEHAMDQVMDHLEADPGMMEKAISEFGLEEEEDGGSV